MVATEDIRIPSSRHPNFRIALTLYKSQAPAGLSPCPVIIMGHGIGAIKAGGIPTFAAAFAAEGYHAVAFDYLHFGDSDGEPRNLMSVAGELQDFRDVFAWVRQRPEMFDSERIVVWGSSFGGMHVTALLAEDHSIAAGIAQCPCVDGFAAVTKAPLMTSLRLSVAAISDTFAGLLGRQPVYIPLISDGQPGSPMALMMGEEVIEGWKRITPEGVDFPNMITARSLLSFSTSRPVLNIHASTRPYLVVLPTWDHQAPLEAAEKAVFRAPRGEALRVDGGHFDLYPGGIAFRKNITGQLAFLKRVLK
ncbi:hypothetical protein LRP88_00266 [Fusarium phalaenopsidis]|nr:Alpha/beta fold family hydrolase [Fusarium sp. Ph1]